MLYLVVRPRGGRGVAWAYSWSIWFQQQVPSGFLYLWFQRQFCFQSLCSAVRVCPPHTCPSPRLVWDLGGIRFSSYSLYLFGVGSTHPAQRWPWEFINNLKRSLFWISPSSWSVSSILSGSQGLPFPVPSAKPWAFAAFSAACSPGPCWCLGLSSWRTERDKEQAWPPAGTPTPLITEVGSPGKFNFLQSSVGISSTTPAASHGAGMQASEEKGENEKWVGVLPTLLYLSLCSSSRARRLFVALTLLCCCPRVCRAVFSSGLGVWIRSLGHSGSVQNHSP